MADFAKTLARAQISQLSLEEQARGFSHKFTINYSDCNSGTVSTDTDTVTLGVLPSLWVVNGAGANVTTAWTGSTGTYAMVVGTTTTTNAFIASTSVKTAGWLVGSVSPAALTNATATASKNIVAIFTDTVAGAATSNTAGVVDVYLNIIDLTSPNKLG